MLWLGLKQEMPLAFLWGLVTFVASTKHNCLWNNTTIWLFFGFTPSTFHSLVPQSKFALFFKEENKKEKKKTRCIEHSMARCRWSRRRMATSLSSLFLGEDRLHLTAADQIWLTKINGRALKSDQFNLATVLGRNREGRLSTRLSSLQFSLNVNLLSGWRKAKGKR